MVATFLKIALLSLFARVAASLDYCPCVPDHITFQFDFAWGCDNNPMNNADFAKVKCNIQSGRLPSNQSITKVVYSDLATKTTQELPVTEEIIQTSHNTTKKVYTFDYQRSFHSPSNLLLDFYQRSGKTPVAIIDLYYSGRSIDCVSNQNPLYWPGDLIYFMKVQSLHDTTDPGCRTPGDFLETA